VSPVVDVTDADFDAVIGASALPAIVDFWAEWCEPCKVMSAYVEFLATDFAGQVLVAALDVDENPATSERFGVMGLPTLLVLQQGKEIDRIVGVAPYEEIKERIEQLLAARNV
jgi:thioredoxin 1